MADTYTLSDLMEEQRTLGGRPALPDVRPREMREPPLGQSNLVHRALSALGQPSLESLRRGFAGQETPEQVARTFLETGPIGPFGMIAGRAARTADHAALRRAEDMTARGASRDEIWNETGWFRGQDGKWRFEIDDSGSRLTNAATASAEYTGPRRRLDEAIDPEAPPGLSHTIGHPSYYDSMQGGFHHPQLYDAYPNMRNDKLLVYRSDNPNGSHASFRDGRNEFSTYAPDDPARRSIALHEVQHGVQAQEGFDRTMPIGRETGRLMQEHSNAINAQLGDILQPQSIWQRWFGPRRPAPPPDSATDDLLRRINETSANEYRRQAAEVEARNVQTRANMTPEQRRATPPWQTQDIPEDQMIWWRQRP